MGVSVKPGSKPLPIVPVSPKVVAMDAPAVDVPIVPSVEAKEKVPVKKSEAAAIIAQIRKDKGEKTIVRGRDVPDVRRIATGIFEFDFATGGGFPCGRYSVIYGLESSCKTNLTYCAIVSAQHGPANCNVAVLVDLEHTFDPSWAELFGIDVDALMVVKPSYGEEAVDIIEALVSADDVAIVVVDSIAMFVSSKESNQSAENFDVGTAALLIKRMVNKVNIRLSIEAKRDHYPSVIFINQIRYKIGVMFGNPETQPGGVALRFLSSLTVRVTGKNVILKEFDPALPMLKHVDAQIIKSKVGIIKSVFDFDLATQPHGDLMVGETNSYSLVQNELQAHGLLKKFEKGQGWRVAGLEFKTLKMLEDTYIAEKAFALKLQQMVINEYSGKKALIDISTKLEQTTPPDAHPPVPGLFVPKGVPGV